MANDFFIFIPAYNVAGTLASVLQKISDEVWNKSIILIIDDGSTDDTRGAFENFAGSLAEERKSRLRYMRFEQNSGYGAVVKKGEGTLVLGAANAVPGAGTFTLEAGDVLLRGGALPPVALGAGETWDAAAYPATPRPDNYSDSTDAKVAFDLESGLRIAKASGAGDTVVKTGDGALRVGAVAGDVKRITVQGGTLELTARETPLTATSAPALCAFRSSSR